MLTTMTEADWALALQIFRAARSRRGDKGRDDRKFLEALQYFAVHNITWRALPREFGHWNSVWKRFWRLSVDLRRILSASNRDPTCFLKTSCRSTTCDGFDGGQSWTPIYSQGKQTTHR